MSGGGGGGGGAHGGGRSSEQKGSLQRISALWDIEKDGPLSQIPVPFDRVGRRWSRKFNVEAAKTAGPLDTSGATLGVSVSALTGHFHRTRVVTLYPRLIVRNFLGIPVEVRMVLVRDLLGMRPCNGLDFYAPDRVMICPPSGFCLSGSPRTIIRGNSKYMKYG